MPQIRACQAQKWRRPVSGSPVATEWTGITETSNVQLTKLRSVTGLAVLSSGKKYGVPCFERYIIYKLLCWLRFGTVFYN